ncbi:MAG: hypothetical protein ACQEQZ_07745, partial [Pseudomonadota bacterium]
MTEARNETVKTSVQMAVCPPRAEPVSLDEANDAWHTYLSNIAHYIQMLGIRVKRRDHDGLEKNCRYCGPDKVIIELRHPRSF